MTDPLDEILAAAGIRPTPPPAHWRPITRTLDFDEQQKLTRARLAAQMTDAAPRSERDLVHSAQSPMNLADIMRRVRDELDRCSQALADRFAMTFVAAAAEFERLLEQRRPAATPPSPAPPRNHLREALDRRRAAERARAAERSRDAVNRGRRTR